MRQRHRRILSGEIEHAAWEGQRRQLDGTPLRLRFSAWRIDWDMASPPEQLVVSDETVSTTLRTCSTRPPTTI